MTQTERLKLMHLAAEMYYITKLTQSEIAKELGVSRPMVSRLLSQASEEGIVQISINNPFADLKKLEKTLARQLGIITVIVAPGESGSPAQVRRRLGTAAARYLESALQHGDKLGIGWGRTLYEVSQALECRLEHELEIVPLMGGLGQISPSFQVHEIARTFAERLGGAWHPFYLPAIIENDAGRQALLQSRDALQITDLWDSLNVAVFGIGQLDIGPEVHMLFAEYVDENTTTNLKRNHAVGDICMHFFDHNGQDVVPGLPGVISFEMDQLRRVPRRIAVAGGKEKAEAILGAIRGGLVNILITEELAAWRILELIENDLPQ